ncbi:hypothetical protein Thimo_0205 [Thioflavicoccus mobilis 8321]|uniref:Uncharacterized protein n=1 Tax=Thioflavicoccus mobilis 8321 TaxID=765912 RepID=L0GTE4_9GAMM|nr:hypothetical protein Thimo_0205 [Thioflavicoccus mobilis 8321]
MRGLTPRPLYGALLAPLSALGRIKDVKMRE